eukprot:3756650-Rhodomonas_salina.4
MSGTDVGHDDTRRGREEESDGHLQVADSAVHAMFAARDHRHKLSFSDQTCVFSFFSRSHTRHACFPSVRRCDAETTRETRQDELHPRQSTSLSTTFTQHNAVSVPGVRVDITGSDRI